MTPIEARDKLVYNKGLTQKVDLGIWETDFQPEGIDLYETG